MINECLRFNPSATVTEEYRITKDCTLGGIKFRKDTQVDFFIYNVHHNPNEWHTPEKFLPDRFNPASELFKAPNGEARHPYSFVPFGFGERKCVGYQLAKVVIPNFIIKILRFFDFEYLDK